MLISERKLEEAHTELDRAVSLDPNNFLANEELLVLYRRTHDPCADQQAVVLKQLDEDRSKRAELMLGKAVERCSLVRG